MGGIVINRRPHGFKFKVEFVSGGRKEIENKDESLKKKAFTGQLISEHGKNSRFPY